jgi:hypothetical protein
MQYLPVLQGLIIAVGAVAAAGLAAILGVRGYREQKRQDREEDLWRKRQQVYERYLLAFSRAGRWKGLDNEKHADAEAEYHEAHDAILLVGSDQVIAAANDFHRYYVYSRVPAPVETKMRYARMVIEMRREGFESTALSVKEVAINIPWTMGDEDVNPINWEQSLPGDQ